MNLDRVSSGDNIPDEINVIIEIPAHSDPVKYCLLYTSDAADEVVPV